MCNSRKLEKYQIETKYRNFGKNNIGCVEFLGIIVQVLKKKVIDTRAMKKKA